VTLLAVAVPQPISGISDLMETILENAIPAAAVDRGTQNTNVERTSFLDTNSEVAVTISKAEVDIDAPISDTDDTEVTFRSIEVEDGGESIL